MLLLCAGLGITKLSELEARKKKVADIMKDAWKALVDSKILTEVKADDTEGYNNVRYHSDNEYVKYP